MLSFFQKFRHILFISPVLEIAPSFHFTAHWLPYYYKKTRLTFTDNDLDFGHLQTTYRFKDYVECHVDYLSTIFALLFMMANKSHFVM